MPLNVSNRTQWDPDALKLESYYGLKVELAGYAGSLRVEIPFHVLTGRKRQPRLLVMAGVHGDEYEGVAVLQDLAKEIDPKKLNGTLTLLPVANPQAFYAGTRCNPVDFGDLNRCFPGNPNGSLSERLAHTLFQEFVLGNEYVLSMHGWSREALVVPYVETPIGKNAACRKSYAAACALGFQYLHLYEWPAGVLGGAAMRYGIAPIEPEVGGMGTVTRKGQSIYRETVYRLLVHLKMLGIADTRLQGTVRSPRIIDHSDIFASNAGLFRSHINLGQSVGKGDVIGTIHALSGQCLEELKSPAAGLVGILRTFGSVQPGDRLVQLFREVGKARVKRHS